MSKQHRSPLTARTTTTTTELSGMTKRLLSPSNQMQFKRRHCRLDLILANFRWKYKNSPAQQWKIRDHCYCCSETINWTNETSECFDDIFGEINWLRLGAWNDSEPLRRHYIDFFTVSGCGDVNLTTECKE